MNITVYQSFTDVQLRAELKRRARPMRRRFAVFHCLLCSVNVWSMAVLTPRPGAGWIFYSGNAAAMLLHLVRAWWLWFK